MPLAKRKKLFVLDGAEYTIAPLTYDEMEAYAEKIKATNEKLSNEEPSVIPEDLRREMLNNALYVVCCGLNNAGIDPLVTPEILRREMDDVLAGALVTEILKFNGLRVPSKKIWRVKSTRGKPRQAPRFHS